MIACLIHQVFDLVINNNWTDRMTGVAMQSYIITIRVLESYYYS